MKLSTVVFDDKNYTKIQFKEKFLEKKNFLAQKGHMMDLIHVASNTSSYR